MTTDPNKTPPAKLVPANDSLDSVLAELRQLARQAEPSGAQKAADAAAPVSQSSRPQMPAPRQGQNLRPARESEQVAFPPRALPTAARPRYARAGTWVVAGGVTLACAALAIPLRSMIFDPLQQDAEVLVGAEPAVAKVEQRAPVEVASAIPEPAAKEPDVAAVEPDTTAPSTTASLAAQMPPKADPVLPSVETPPVATSDLIRAEAPPAASVATQPVETASISLVKLPSELKPTAAGSVAAPSTIETASAGPVRAPSDARPSAAAAEGSPRDAVSTSDPKPDLGRSPVADASVPKASASDASSPSAGAVPASGPGIASDAGTAGTALSEVSADRKAGGSGPTRMAALGSVPESSATAAIVPAPAKPSPEMLRMVERARELIKTGDISAARLLLERAMRSGSPQATFQLAETYDPQVLARWGTFGIKGDVDKARELYGRALKNGIADSKPRLEALR